MNNIFRCISEERNQAHVTRKALFSKIEGMLGRPLITFFTSFSYPVSLDDDDVEMLQGILQLSDLRNGFALLISSPGGDGLAAERIIKACRSHSGSKEYWCVVAGKAKSAATMVCLGASKIMMAPTSELGPVDPQIIRKEDGKIKRFSAHNYVKSYTKMFQEAVKAKGNMQPYLQQLSNYDEREIEEFRSIIELAEDIAVRTLSTGMMEKKSKPAIRKAIDVFLTPSAGTKSHGRPIYFEEADKCGLTIENLDVTSDLWQAIYELNIRTDLYVSSNASKCIESKDHAFAAPPPPRNQQNDE